MSSLSILTNKIDKKKAKITVIGLGYVGLPLAVSFAKKGWSVYGYDTNKKRVDRLKRGQKYITDIDPLLVTKLIDRKKFLPTADAKTISESDVLIICVPTPLRKVKTPDISYIVKASRAINKYLKKGQLVILESTTYPGTSREVILPILKKSGLKEEKDFFLSFSPERIDPGNKEYPLNKIPKVVGGIGPKSTRLTKKLYSNIIQRIVPVSSIETAETVKLLENSFRLVNIGLANEFALACDKLGINVWEVIKAASTKPFGFSPFYPGPGIGGHCLDAKEVVVLRNNKNQTCFRSLEEVFKEESDNSPFKHKLQDIDILKPNKIKMLSFDLDKGKTTFKKVSLMTRRKSKDPLLKIVTEGNRKILVSDKHPMIVEDKGKFLVKQAQDLQVNDNLPFLTKYPFYNGEKMQTIDLINCLTKSSLVRKIRVKSSILNWSDYDLQFKELNVKYDIRRDWYRNNFVPLECFLKAEEKELIKTEHSHLILCSGKGPSYSEFPAVIDLDTDFWRLIGYYLSEGCITKDKSYRTRFTFHSQEKECINDVTSILNNIKIKYSLYQSKRYKSFHIKVSSNLLGFLIKEILGCGVDSYSMHMPDIVFSQPLNCRVELLKGILRGDGGVDVSFGKRDYIKNKKHYCHQRNSACINYFTINKVLFNQVISVLHQIGIIPSFKRRDNLLVIYGYNQIEKMRDFFLDEKRKKIEEFFLRHIRPSANKTFLKYSNFATSKVRRIEKNPPDYVYSMEVNDTNTFITSHGFIVHNCIPADPMYLSWKARKLGFKTKMIDLASFTNHFMPEYITKKIKDLLKVSTKKKKPNILLVGVTYKKDVKDLRDSPALDIVDRLKKERVSLDYYDPLIPYLKLDGINLKSIKLTKSKINQYDCIVIITDHTKVDYEFLQKNAKLIFDTRNVYKKDIQNVVRL